MEDAESVALAAAEGVPGSSALESGVLGVDSVDPAPFMGEDAETPLGIRGLTATPPDFGGRTGGETPALGFTGDLLEPLAFPSLSLMVAGGFGASAASTEAANTLIV